MTDEARARAFLEKFFEARPKKFFKELDDGDKGLFAVLRMLACADGRKSAGDVANELHMSTPRVAAALKSLERKEYIVREASSTDARKTEVCITDEGRAALCKEQAALEEIVDYLMETVGERDMNELLRISGVIAAALDKTCNDGR